MPELIRGKRDNLVFFSRLNKILIRTYVKPQDPRTAEQLLRRYSFRFVNKLYNFLPKPIFFDIWQTIFINDNPHNNFVKINQTPISEELNFYDILTTKGNAEPINSIGFIKYKDVNGRCNFKWSTTITDTGKPTDKILLTLIDYKNYKPSENLFNLDIYINHDKIRSDSIGFILPAKDLDVNFMHGFISVVNTPIIDKYSISNSLNKKVIPF